MHFSLARLATTSQVWDVKCVAYGLGEDAIDLASILPGVGKIGDTAQVARPLQRFHRNHEAPKELASLLKNFHNMLKREISLKVGIQGKRLQASWREDYLLKVLLS